MAYAGSKTESQRLQEVMAARPKMLKFHVGSFAVGCGLFLLLNLATTGLSWLWCVWPIGLWGVFLALHLFTYRGAQAQDAKRIAELSGKEGFTALGSSLAISVLNLPEQVNILQQNLNNSLKQLQEALGRLSQENPELPQALSQAKAQSETLINALGTLYRSMGNDNQEELERQKKELEAKLVEASPENKAVLEARLAAVSERLQSLSELRQEAKLLEDRLNLVKEQLDSLRLELAKATKVLPNQFSSLEASLKNLKTEVHTAKEISELGARGGGVSVGQ